MTSAPPLLVLAAGGRPRLRRARIPVPKESKLHTDVVHLLNAHCLPDWRWRHINSKAMDAREGVIMKYMGVKRGWFDFILISPKSLPHFLETKRFGEVLSDDQVEFQDWCIACNIPQAAAWTFDQVLAAFDSWECLRIAMPRRRERVEAP